MDSDSKRSRIEAEASDWLVRLEAGGADLGAFEAWRAADAAHAAAFAELDAAWARLDRAAALRSGDIDADLLAPEINDGRRWFMRAAAGFVLVAGGVGGAALLTGARASAETRIGERRALRLEDGTLLDLNTNSRASWRMSENRREVWLERGEAALEIVGGEAPFWLNVAGRAIELTPGAFNARLGSGAAEILVVRGRASTLGADAAQGILIDLAADQTSTRALSVSAEVSATAWRRGEIVFDGETLAEAVAEYNRYLSAGIVIRDPAISDLRLGGRFTTQDPTEFLQALEAAFPVEVERTPEGGALLFEAS